ncbi:MAG: hypothetical protein R6U59_05640 [Eubacteriales bacterium]
MKSSVKNRNIEKNPIKVQRGTLENGLENVSKYLDLKPEKSVFLHSTVVNDDVMGRRLFYKPSFAHSQILSILPRKTSWPKGVCLYVNKELREYLSQVGLAPKDNYIYIDKYPSKDSYPYFSVSGYFKEYIKGLKDEDLQFLKNSSIVSSFISKDDEYTANFLNGNLIMNLKEQVKFNSKYYLRKLSQKYDFSVPLGVPFKGLDSLETAFNSLYNILLKSNCKPEISKIWCKFQSQTSGMGSFSFQGFSKESFENTKEHVKEFCRKINIPEEDMKREVPLVLEVDVSSMPYEKQIANIGVEAVISCQGITLVGCVSQESRNGKYIGSIIDKSTKDFRWYAEESALPFLKAIQEEGYRGFITIDILLTRSKDGIIKGYNIDPNARFTAGTPLLSLIQYSEKMSGLDLFGFSYSNAIKDSKELFERVKYYCGDNLYLGEESNFTGIIPIILNDVNFFENKKRYLRTVVISESISSAESIYSDFKRRILDDLNS